MMLARRDTDLQLGDTARILAILYTFGFFAIVLTLMIRGMPPENKDAINLLLGMLGLIQAGIVKFYFDGTKSAERSAAAVQDIARTVPSLPPAPLQLPLKADEVKVDATGGKVTIDSQPKGNGNGSTT